MIAKLRIYKVHNNVNMFIVQLEKLNIYSINTLL